MFILYYIEIISTPLTQAARQKPGLLPVGLIRKKSADALLKTPCMLFKSSLIFLLFALTPIFLNIGRTEQEHLSYLTYAMSAMPISKVYSLDYFQGYSLGYFQG